jgi:hypothetical protein
MEAVFRFVEDHGIRPVHDLRRHLFTSVGGKAMHEQRVRPGLLHQAFVDLIGAQEVVTAFGVVVSHGNPAVGHDAVGILYRFIWVGR